MSHRIVKHKLKAIVGHRQLLRRVTASVQSELLPLQSKKPIFISETSVLPVIETYSSDNPNIDKHTQLHIDANVNSDNSSNDDFNTDSLYDVVIENDAVGKQSETLTSFDLLFEIKDWALQHKITHCAINDILRRLAKIHPELPLDARTLLHTPRNITIKQLNNGEYCHLGLVQNLRTVLMGLNQQSIELLGNGPIKISFNIDGLPLFHSSSLQFWPILGLIKNVHSSPFTVGLFCGRSKPSPLNSYLDDFIMELNTVLKEGILFCGKMYPVEIHSFICDAPAKAFIKCIKSHGGYASCDKCTEYGAYVQGRLVLINTSSPRRTHDSFLRQEDEDHHMGVSPLVHLDIDLIVHFPIDYMHACCLGVCRKLLNFWMKGNLTTRLSSKLVKIISEHLIALRDYIPSEFNRKPRKLDELQRWKASEFRTFLLYTGPFILKGVVDLAVYEHFLLFHSAVSILISAKHIATFGIDVPKELFDVFIKHCEKLYGKQFLIYNIHILCHLCDDVEKYGPLDLFSAFPFESHLGRLKSLIKSPTKPLQQICKRMSEGYIYNQIFIGAKEVKCCFEHNLGPLLVNFETQLIKQFKKVTLQNFTLNIVSHSKANAYCILVDNTVFEIANIVIDATNSISLIGKKFKTYAPLYHYPFSSLKLNIRILSDLDNELILYHIGNVSSKCMVFPSNGNWVCLPIIHTI